MKIDVFNINGEKTPKSIELPDSIFGIVPNDHAIYLDVKRILAAKRQGTHKAKERHEITGSTRKLRKQKGLGAARVGSIKSPLFRGGGRIFGPLPRDYSFKLNKKVKELARKSALTYKCIDQQIVIIEDFQLSEPKTREFVSILKNLNCEKKKSLIVINDLSNNINLSARNIPNTYVCTPDNLNTYDILNNDLIIISESSVEQISKTLN